MSKIKKSGIDSKNYSIINIIQLLYHCTNTCFFICYVTHVKQSGFEIFLWEYYIFSEEIQKSLPSNIHWHELCNQVAKFVAKLKVPDENLCPKVLPKIKILWSCQHCDFWFNPTKLSDLRNYARFQSFQQNVSMFWETIIS